MPILQIIIVSTRPGRVGLPVGEWVAGHAQAHAGFDVEVVDLAELALPFMDEPNHPRLQRYEHEHTKAWSATVARAEPEAVSIPFVTQFIDDEGRVEPNETMIQSATTMLDELVRVEAALRPLRAG